MSEAKAGLLDSKQVIDEAIQRVQTTVEAGLQKAEAASGKLVPDEVTGTLQNYRFGKFKNEMHPDGNESSPVHVFEVDLGNEVLLHIAIGSDRWDTFVATLDEKATEALEGGSSIGELLQGKRIQLLRDSAYGRFVPTALASEEDQEPIGTDRNGTNVFKGTRVYLREEAANMKLVRYNTATGYFEGVRDDGIEGTGTFDEESQMRLYNAATNNIEVAT